MAANVNPIFELTPVNEGVTIDDGDTTTKKTVFTAGTDGGRVDSISICSDDTSAVNLAFYIYDGVNDLYIGNVNVPIGSGYTTVAKVDGMSTLRPASQPFIQLKGGYLLKCNAVITVTAGKIVTIVGIGGNF
jgi:hypothetical protein